MNSSKSFNKIDFSNQNLLNNTDSFKPQRDTTPPKRPAVLCRNNSNTPKQNTLLQNSNNKNVMNMPSPHQINFQNLQICVNNQNIFNQSLQPLQNFTPNSSEILNQKAFSSTTINNQMTNKHLVTSSFSTPTQGLDTRIVSLHQPQSKYNNQIYLQQNQEIIRNNSHNSERNNQKELNHQPNLSVSKQNIQLHDQSFERKSASTHQNSNSISFVIKSLDQNKQEFLNSQQQQNLQHQQSQVQQQHQNFINSTQLELNNTMKQNNFIQNQTQKIDQNKGNTSDRNLFINQEQNVISPKQQQSKLQEQADSNNSYKVMMQFSDEIERMNNEVKNKNKELLQLQVKYDTLLEDVNVHQNQYDNILQQKEIMLQSQIQINQNSQLQINALLQEIERLTFAVNSFSNVENKKQETSVDLRQKIEKLIEMNENLLTENKELGEENMFLSQQMLKNQQEADNLLKKNSEQSHKLLIIQKKNDEILEKYTNYKTSHEKEKKGEKQNGYEQNTYEEEIESIKYLLKEKIQEIEILKIKYEGYQNDYKELELRLQTALNCNQILNNKLVNFTQIDIMKYTSEDQLTEQVKYSGQSQFEGEAEQQQQSEEDKLNVLLAQQKENKNNKPLSSDRYQLLKQKKREIQVSNGFNQQTEQIVPQLSSRYGISSSQYQNRIQGLQNIPLKDCGNKMNNQKFLTNDTIESARSKSKNFKFRK